MKNMNNSNSSLTERTERKKGEPISLKTKLEDVPINPKLYRLKRLSVSELVNQPTIKTKFSIASFANAMRKGLLNTSSIIRGKDLNRTEADLTPFSSMDVLSETSFTNNPLESESGTYTYRPSNTHRKSKLLGFNKLPKEKNKNNSNTFTMLVKEDYSGYIKILKRIYPSFKFNHYNRISNEYFEYYKKYGEEGDINNRNYLKKKKNKKEGEYKKSNLLDILGVQENISVDPKVFKIKSDFLMRSDPYELKMIKEDLSFKTGVIDKELNQILESEANILYNYIEKNIDLKNQINDFSIEMKNKINFQRKLSREYILNSAKLFLKENKKKQIQKLLKPLKILNELGICMKQLKFISLSENENKIKQISDSTNIAREKIKLLKEYNIKSQNKNVLFEIESKITNYENQGELKLNDQLAENYERLFNLTLIYNKEDEIYNIVLKSSSDNTNNKKAYILEKEENNNIFIYTENDFDLIKEEENIYIKYLLIYNNNKIDNKIYKLLISILDMFDIIIKDNMDITSIFDIFKNLFHKIISKNFETIENISKNKLTNINILSNCYSIILSNFFYTIELIKDNFGLNAKKIFNDVIEMIKNEMDELIKALILAYLHEKSLDIENSWAIFLKEESYVKSISKIYFQNSKIQWSNMTMNLYQEYISNFNKIKTKELTEEYNNLSWDQILNINKNYQQMFNILNTNQNINKLQIPSDKIILINKSETEASESEEKNEYLELNNEKTENDKKLKISKFSYDFIKYAYEYLVIYTSSPNELKDEIINKIMKLTKDILIYTRDIVVNNDSGKINDKQITEKETALYYSDLIIIQKCLKNFIEAKNFGNVLLTSIQETIDTLNALKNTCIDIIKELIKGVNQSFISDFNNLDFKNYKTFSNAKEYNSYTKRFSSLKRLYDNSGNAFLTEDIKNIFSDGFNNMMNNFKQCVIEKGIIEKEDQLKQFRNELSYIKKVFKFFKLIESSKYIEILDELSIKANPNIIPKKKKKVKHNKEEDKNDENEG